MRARRTCAIILACGFSIGAALFVAEKSKRTAISLDRVSYRRLPGDRLIADFQLINTGNTPIEFHRLMNARLRSEGPEGWTKDTIHNGSVERSIVLAPNARTAVSIPLPKDTGRWQLGYEVRPPMPGRAAAGTAPPMALTSRPQTISSTPAWLGRYVEPWLQQRPPRSEEVWTQTFDAKAWLAANPNAPIYMEIPFGAIFRQFEASSH